MPADSSTHRFRKPDQHIACGPGVIKRFNHRLGEPVKRVLKTHGPHHVIPFFQICVIRKNEIGHQGGFIPERAEAHDKRNLFQGSFKSPSTSGQGMGRVGGKEKEHFHGDFVEP
jgi:hypothetical protein